MPWEQEGGRATVRKEEEGVGESVCNGKDGNERDGREEGDGGGDWPGAMVTVSCLAYTTVEATTVATAANVDAMQPISSHQALAISCTPAGLLRSSISDKEKQLYC